MKAHNTITALGLCLAAAQFCLQARAYDEGPVASGGSISGFVYFDGTPPERKPLDVKAPCQHAALSEDVVVAKAPGKDGGKDTGRLVNAVVTISDIKKGKAFDAAAAASLDQKGCVFTPHVVWVGAGSKLKILNSDDVNHNVHTKSDLNTEMNSSVSPKGQTTAKFDEPERIAIRCDMHTWMKAWIVVAENPYTSVTRDDGAFKLGDVPAGTYTVTVWQETLGERKMQVTVKAGEDAHIEISYK